MSVNWNFELRIVFQKWAGVSSKSFRMATTSSSMLLVVLQLLLICSGDVEVNPGPLDQGEIYVRH